MNTADKNKVMFTLCNNSTILNVKNNAPAIIKLRVSVILLDFLYKNFFDNSISQILDPSKG